MEEKDQLQKVLQMEARLSEEEYTLGPSFEVKVMERLEVENNKSALVAVKRLFMTKKTYIRIGIATAATLVLASKLMLDRTLIEKLGDPVSDKSPPAPASSKHIAPQANELPMASPARSPSSKGEEKQVKRNGIAEIVDGFVPAQWEKKEALQSRRANVDILEPQNPVESKGVYYPSSSASTNTAEFARYEENPRISTAQEGMSTFSIDVDTASYSLARKFLNQGALPPKDSVRIEEFINYFDYNYPVQTEKPFSLNYEIAPSPLDSGRYLLKLGVKARDQKAAETPWNLVFLVDVSGSMSPPDRLELVKSGLKVLLNSMKKNDKISIVTYAGQTGVLIDSATLQDKAKIISAIDSLGAGGGTNGSGGIEKAYALAEQNMIKGGVNRVVLATDGDFNVGVTSFDELVKMIERKRKSGVTLTTLGVGQDNFKDQTLEQLADKGNGNYFYLDSLKETRKVLSENVTSNMEIVAKDVKLQIEFNPEQVQEYRLIGYDNRKLRKEDFNNDQIDAGEIGSSHNVTAIYELVLANTEMAKRLSSESRYQKPAKPESESEKKEPEQKQSGQKDSALELAFLKIRYKNPESSESNLLEFPILAKDVLQSAEQASDDFRFAAAVSYFGTLLRDSQFAGNYSYEDVAELAAGAKGKDESAYRAEFISLVKDAAQLSKQP